MKNQEVTLILHRNIIEDLPKELRTYATRLDAMPGLKKTVIQAATAIDTWLKADTVRIRCVKPYEKWEWLAETCKAMKSWVSAMVIETKLEQWRVAQQEAENAVELKAARMALEANGVED